LRRRGRAGLQDVKRVEKIEEKKGIEARRGRRQNEDRAAQRVKETLQ